MPQATKALVRKTDGRIVIQTTNYVSHLANRGSAWKSQFSMTPHEAAVLRDQLNNLVGDQNEQTTE